MPKPAAFSLTDSHRSQPRAGESHSESRPHVGRTSPNSVAKEKVKYRRRTIELHPEMEKMLESLQIELRLRSQTEVMQKAIQLLGFIMGEEDGVRKRVYIEKENGSLRELLIL